MPCFNIEMGQWYFFNANFAQKNFLIGIAGLFEPCNFFVL